MTDWTFLLSLYIDYSKLIKLRVQTAIIDRMISWLVAHAIQTESFSSISMSFLSRLFIYIENKEFALYNNNWQKMAPALPTIILCMKMNIIIRMAMKMTMNIQ